MNPNAKAGLAIALSLIALPCFRTNALAQEAARPVVVVHVYNNADVPELTLAEGGLYVREIFDNIGVETLWLDSRSRLQTGGEELLENQWSSTGNLHLSIVIVSRPVPGAPFNVRDPGVMGFTLLGKAATRSYVFHDRVKAFVAANRWKLPFLRIPRLLAYAVAHEMGHLLIANDGAHSSSGIMQKGFYFEDMERASWGTLFFSGEEGQWIRDEVQRRVRP